MVHRAVAPDPAGGGGDPTNVPFVPSSLAVLHLASPTAGAFLALDDAGGLFVELSPLVLSPYLRTTTLCSDGTPFFAEHVVIGRFGDLPVVTDETLLLASGDVVYPLVEARCFGEGIPLVDDQNQPIFPRFAVGVDLDGDGVDTLVWGHP